MIRAAMIGVSLYGVAKWNSWFAPLYNKAGDRNNIVLLYFGKSFLPYFFICFVGSAFDKTFLQSWKVRNFAHFFYALVNSCGDFGGFKVKNGYVASTKEEGKTFVDDWRVSWAFVAVMVEEIIW